MNRTFTININGRIYIINDDAYMMLQDYLNKLNLSFTGPDGTEIVADIESRIADHFDEALAAERRQVITIVDVRNVIATMGRPEEISDSSCDSDRQYHNYSTSTNRAATSGRAPAEKPRKRLYRSVTNKWFGGVLGGLAAYLGWDPTILRLIYAALCIATGGWPFVIAYFVAWMVIPRANTPRRILEMQGQPVTVGNVSQTVLGNTPPPYPGTEDDTHGDFMSVLGRVASVCAKVIMGIVGIIAAIAALGCVIVFITVLVAVLFYCFASATLLLDAFDLSDTLDIWSILFGTLIAIIPLIGLCWAACSVLFGAKGASKTMIISAVIIEVLLIAALVIGLAVINTFPQEVNNLCLLEGDMKCYADAAAVYLVSRVAV